MKIALRKKTVVELPLYQEVKEGKVELTYRILQNPKESTATVLIEPKTLQQWLKEEKSQRYPFPVEAQYMLFHRYERLLIFMVQAEMPDGAELDLEIKWNVIEAVVKNETGDSKRLVISKETAQKQNIDDDEEAEQEQKKKQEQADKKNEANIKMLKEQNAMLQELVNRQMDRRFCESGEYEQKLREMSEWLESGEGKKKFLAWLERKDTIQKEIDMQQRELTELENKCKEQEAQLTAVETKVQETKNRLKEEEEKVKKLETVNEETLQKLERYQIQTEKDKELLQFLQDSGLEIETLFKQTEKTLHEAEETMRKAIIMKEEKSEKIQEKVRK